MNSLTSDQSRCINCRDWWLHSYLSSDHSSSFLIEKIKCILCHRSVAYSFRNVLLEYQKEKTHFKHQTDTGAQNCDPMPSLRYFDDGKSAKHHYFFCLLSSNCGWYWNTKHLPDPSIANNSVIGFCHILRWQTSMTLLKIDESISICHTQVQQTSRKTKILVKSSGSAVFFLVNYAFRGNQQKLHSGTFCHTRYGNHIRYLSKL